MNKTEVLSVRCHDGVGEPLQPFGRNATYAHVLPTVQMEAADKLNAAFNRVKMGRS